MDKVLFLNLPSRVLKAGSRWYNRVPEKKAQMKYYPFPWMMAYAVSLLKSKGFNVDFKDAVAMEWTPEKTLDYIKKTMPNYIVCEPSWTSSLEDKEFIKKIREIINNVIIIAVGNYSTNYPLQCLDLNVDYSVVGEYEFSLLEYFNNKFKIPKNFVSKEKKEYSYPDLIDDLDLLPFPERDLTPWYYYNEPSCYGKNIVIVSSRGCRLKCNFCNVESIYGKHILRVRNPKKVVDEMEYVWKKYKVDDIYFDDDNMTSDENNLKEICKELINRKLKIRWLCMGDAMVKDETLEYLAKAGCKTYKFGVEHLDEEVLRFIPKPVKKERVYEIIKKCKELKMMSYVNLMIGLPKSTREKDLKMVKEIIEMKPDLIQFSIAIPYPGTKFYRQAEEFNWFVNKDPSYFDTSGNSPISYPDYKDYEIINTFNECWLLWKKYVMLHKPKTLLFFILSNIKREGLFNSFMKIIYYFISILRKKDV